MVLYSERVLILGPHQATNSFVSNSPIDRNGLRPSRYYVTKDRVLVMASEVGVYDTEPENILQKVTRAATGQLNRQSEKLVKADHDIHLQLLINNHHSSQHHFRT